MTAKEFISALREAIFPMRTHMQQEITFLKAQLAYQQRRGDELTARLMQIATPQAKAPREVPPMPKIVATSWDSYRAAKRGDHDTTEEAAPSDAPAVIAAG